MAILNILTPEELANREQKPAPRRTGRRRSAERTRAIEEFKAGLAQATPGYGADVLLSENEDKRIVRQNLKAAADELGMALDFRPIKVKNRIHFRIITPEEKAARPYRGGGRPKKVPPEALRETNVEAPQETNGNGTAPQVAPPARSRRRRNLPQEATPAE